MFRNLQMIISKTLQCNVSNAQTKRTTFILRRRNQPYLNKMGAVKPKKMKNKFYYYDLVEDTRWKKLPEVDLILLKNVRRIGNAGDIIRVNQLKAYEYFILSGAAAMGTPENREKYAHLRKENAIPIEMQNLLSKLNSTPVPIFLHEENPWTIQPWHVRLALRKIGVICNEDCIKIPEKEISGPSMDLEKKDFPIHLTVNKQFTVPMRCRIFHLLLSEVNYNISFNPEFYLDPIKAVFPEDQSMLEKIPLPESKSSFELEIID